MLSSIPTSEKSSFQLHIKYHDLSTSLFLYFRFHRNETSKTTLSSLGLFAPCHSTFADPQRTHIHSWLNEAPTLFITSIPAQLHSSFLYFCTYCLHIKPEWKGKKQNWNFFCKSIVPFRWTRPSNVLQYHIFHKQFLSFANNLYCPNTYCIPSFQVQRTFPKTCFYRYDMNLPSIRDSHNL